MKLNCNLLVQPLGTSDSRRSAKGIISLGKSKGDVSPQKFEVHVCTPKDIRGRNFPLNKETLRVIQSRFINDGRATLQFKQPLVDIFISEAIPEQLKKFIVLVESAVNGKEVKLGTDEAVKGSDFATTQRALVIKEKEQYPRYPQGYPPNLQTLFVSGLRLKAVDGRWFGLTALQNLDLSENFLGKSENFGTKFLNVVRLRSLRTLSLANNAISFITTELWLALPTSLVNLDLSGNELTSLSPSISRLENLTRLQVSKNELETLPDEICRLRLLRFLDASDNRLCYVPGSLSKMKFENVDFSGNAKLFTFPDNSKNEAYTVPKLAEISAAVVRQLKLPTEMLPWDLRYSLPSYTAICSVCLHVFPKSSTHHYMWLISLTAISRCFSLGGNGNGRQVAARYIKCPTCLTSS